MQTSIIQLLTGAPSSSGQKMLLADSSNGDAFGKLFLQLELEGSVPENDQELNDSDSTDTETPDELLVGPEIKTPQQPDTKNVITPILEASQQGPVTETHEHSPARSKDSGSTLYSEQHLLIPAQVVSLGLEKRGVTENTQNLTHLSGVSQLSENTPSFDASARSVTIEKIQPPRPDKLETPVSQHPNGPVSSSIQIPQTLGANAQADDIQTLQLRQVSSEKPVETNTHISSQANIRNLVRSNESQSTENIFEHAKDLAAKPIDSDKTHFFKPAELVDRNRTLPDLPAKMNSAYNLSSPSTATNSPATNVSGETTEIGVVSGEIIDKFMHAIEIAEAKLDQTIVANTVNTSSAIASEPVRAGIVRSAGTQIVDALIQQPDKAIEIALSPEELGRVRIGLNHMESGLTVTITAERPETLDLMRRHIEQLESEFRRLGYESIGFEFSGDDTNSSDQSQTSKQPQTELVKDTPDPENPTQTSTPTTGVDIRL